jgi:putative membrane protein
VPTGRRLHPAGIAVLAVRALRQAALPAVIGLLATMSGGGMDSRTLLRGVAFAALAAVVSVLVGFITWRTARYSVSSAAITSRRGVFAVSEKVVPLERVQALDTVQGPLQRLFGVTAVHVQAAGGAREGEIVLEALSAQAVDELRDAVGRGNPAPAAAPGATWRLGGGRLTVAAVTAGQLGVILPVLAGASQGLDDLLGSELRSGRELLPDSPGELVLALVVLLVVAWLLSIAGAIVAFWGFTATRKDDRLLIRRGLFARREASVPLARVQAVTVVEGMLRQPFSLVALRVETAGYASEAAAAQTLFPLLRRDEVEGFLAEMVPSCAGGIARLEPVPRRARRRYALAPAALGAGVAGAVTAVVDGAGPWPWLLVIVGLAAGLASHRAAGWLLDDDRVLIRGRRVGRRTVIVPRARLQEHSVGQTILQRRGALASLSVAAGAGTRARVAHLDARVARELCGRLPSTRVR